MDLERLFQAVYDDPRNDAARLVLADALTQVGDPRGEFITLQFDGSARARKRADKLLERHRATFLGPLAKVVRRGSDQWEKGFLARCVAKLDGSLASSPVWATVQELGVEIDYLATRPTELASKWLTSLARVYLADPVFPSQHAYESVRNFLPVVEDVLKSVGRERLLT